jgi:SAM-dependent methyltransferase
MVGSVGDKHVGKTCCGHQCACIDCTMPLGGGQDHAVVVGPGPANPGGEGVAAPAGSLDEVRVRCAPSVDSDRDRALAEAHRVLKPGGRLVVRSTTWVVEPPAEVRRTLRGTLSCLAGAPTLHEYIRRLVRAGFREVRAERHPDGDRTPSLGWEPPLAGVAPTLGVVLTAIK